MIKGVIVVDVGCGEFIMITMAFGASRTGVLGMSMLEGTVWDWLGLAVWS